MIKEHCKAQDILIKPVNYGEPIYIQTTRIGDRFLVGGIEKNNLPYSKNAFEEAATISSKFNKNDNLVWFIKSKAELSNNDSIFLKHQPSH